MKNLFIKFLAIIFLAGVSSCVKEKFSAPTLTNSDPDLVPNTTIGALAAMAANSPTLASTTGLQITQSLILSAVVVGDDKSGNLYKQLAIEDSTGAIMLMINGVDLYTSYPVGRRLFIQLQGLYVATYDGTNEIVASVDNGSFSGIPLANLSRFVVPGKWGVSMAPKLVSLSQLVGNISSYQSQLIQLNDVEFETGYRGVPYANAVYELSGSLLLQDCNFNSITVYTSGYADFANSLSPSGKGTVVGIPSAYTTSSGTTAQLVIRDTTDLSLTGALCQ